RSLSLVAGKPIEIRLGMQSDIEVAYEKLYGGQKGSLNQIVKEIAAETGAAEEDIDRLRDLASEEPVIRLVNSLIARAVESRASDIHIEPFLSRLSVRFRIDGLLREGPTPPFRLRSAIASRVKIMAKLNIAERRLPQDGRIKLPVKDREIDMRVSTLPTVYGESMVIRILDKQESTLSLDKLGFEPDTLALFRRCISQPHGMILVTGPTGSGKTTTLYAALMEISRPDVKIITVEDPVEYQIHGINQVQVKPQIDLNFANALRAIVRQDPDIIMIGEIRDGETADIAIQSALTGHLVLSTIHTNDSFSAPHRLLDMGAESYLISSSLIMVLAQRLVRLICMHCREARPVTEADRLFLTEEGFDPAGVAHLWHGRGCAHCGHTGYSGRQSIYELLPVTDTIKSAILRKAPSVEIRRLARAEGVRTMRQAGILKAIAGETTLDELSRVTREEY
ncbi:MAG: Flp pilus assembly complex ATPase component TadA, partial [Burkholderiales bacterium]|nr:Flp pilus assembly complex ATPase component TadA [Burkholderiales bacterium]